MTNQPAPSPPIRRIVTGHDEKNVAKVIRDGPADNTRRGSEGNTSTLIWSTDRTPCDISIGEDVEDLGARKIGTPPPPNGTRFTVNVIPPGTTGKMHRTETVDYIVIMAGEVEMEMDDSTISMKAGDVMVQRGTNHAWHNRGTVPARIAFVLMDATPLGIGHPLKAGESASHKPAGS